MSGENGGIVVPEALGSDVKPIVFRRHGDEIVARDAPPRALVNLAMIGRGVGEGIPVVIEFVTSAGPLRYRVVGATFSGSLVCEKETRKERRRAASR